MGKSLAACVVALAVGAVSCGATPPPQPVDIGSLSIAPPAPSAKASAPTAISRPQSVIAWIRLDDVDGLLDLVGVSGTSLAASPFMSEVVPYYEALELHRPIDVVVVATGKRPKIDVAARVGLRDPKGFFRELSKKHDVVEDGDHVVVREKTRGGHESEEGEHDGDVVLRCDLAGTNPEIATCGTPGAMDTVGEWLRGGPEPRVEDSVRTGKGGSMARATLYGDSVRKAVATAGEHANADSTERAFLDLLQDIDVVSIDFAREQKDLSFVLGTRLRSASSTIAKEMLTKPNDEKPGDPFFRIWQDGSAVAFTPGGGPMPAWAASMTDSFGSQSHDGSSSDPSSAARALGKALEKPVTIGYGIRSDHAKTALAAVRTAKDPEKAVAALERALDGYLVYALAVEPAVAERTLKDLASAWNASAEDQKRLYGTSYPATTHAVRAAPAKLGLPKGSFFFDTASADTSQPTSANGTMKTKTEHVVHVPIAGATWGLSCHDEKACVEGAKKLMAPKSEAKRQLDVLFERKGIALAGYLSSLVGAFTMHRVSVGASARGGVGNDVLTEIEHDLASPRLELPFVLTTEKQGDGGTVAFEMRGQRDAYKMIGEHLGLGAGGSAAMFIYAILMFAH